MRPLFASLLVLLGFGVQAPAQTCTGLCLQQVSCPTGATTSISGTVYAPNGIDPLPNVTVYIPNAAVGSFTPGVSCPVPGAVPPGSPLVGTVTAVDGTFKIVNVPVGTNIPLVAVTGRWRRQTTIDTSAGACLNTPVVADTIRMPKNKAEGDIPKFAIVTGGADAVECVLHKMKIDDAEFTSPLGTGRINLYTGTVGPGATVSGGTLTQDALTGAAGPTLNNYDVLMLPCDGSSSPQAALDRSTLVGFANAGGRVYSSHYSYNWMTYTGSPFNPVANWAGTTLATVSGTPTATVNTGFSAGQTLSQWLELVGASPTAAPAAAQIPLTNVKHDLTGVNPPTQIYATLNQAIGTDKSPVMQFVFDTPVGQTINQCGKVLYNEYHVETAGGPTNSAFPGECDTATTLTAQEKLLEFSLFELTADGGTATLTPLTQDFGTQAISFNSAPQTFTWTNHSSFTAGVTLMNTTGDFTVTGSNCASVAAGASCTITVIFSPTDIGARTGTLNVGSAGQTLISTLTGIGTPDLAVNLTALAYGNQDVGASTTQTVVVTNVAAGTVPVPAFAVSGDYSLATTCGSTLALGGSCKLMVTFTPTTTGSRPGVLSVNSPLPVYANTSAMLTGNGIDFTLAVAPTSGHVIAGYQATTTVTTTPLAGFGANVVLTCTTNAPGSTCTPQMSTYVPAAQAITVTITTTSQYTVIGFGGVGGGGHLWLLAVLSGGLLWIGRRRVGRMARVGVMLVFVALAGLSMTGCSGKQPAQNAGYTPAGNYTYTLSATDGFLVHTATYSLNITVK